MEYSNRNEQPVAAAPAQSTAARTPGTTGKHSNKTDKEKLSRIGIVAAIAAIVILLIGVIIYTASGSNQNNESKYVYTNKLQAVFLNTGQVYFGNLKTINNNYLVLTNIYYLQTSGGSSTSNSSSSNTSVSLVKLGCELHQPYDQMVINRASVTFWENLQSTGQVATAVATFQRENPHGQKCSDQSSSASTSSVNNTQNATSNSSSTTP